MFGIEGKFVAEFNLGDKKNIITQQSDLFDFTLVEQAGNVPPTFALQFQTTDDDIPLYINEGNELKVTLGKNFNETESYSLLPQNTKSYKTGEGRHVISITGLHNSLNYFDTKTRITDKINGATALELVGGEYFIVENDLDKTSQDIMYHNQYNISSKKFINNIWLSTYLDGSFPIVGITSTGKMLLKDAKKLINQDAKWVLNYGQGQNLIKIAPDYILENKKGFFNNLVGVGREKFLYDQDDAIGIIQGEDVKNLIALVNVLGVKADRENKEYENGVINENVHKNYWKAHLRNITSLALYSSINLEFNFQNTFYPIHIYDTVYFRESSTEGKKASEYASGNYIVTKVVKRIDKHSYITICDACRDSFNQQRGNLK